MPQRKRKGDRPVIKRAAARATALLDAAHSASADGDGPTWHRTSVVQWDEARTCFAVATNDDILWDRELRSFVVSNLVPVSDLIILGADPVSAVHAARRFYVQATTNERAAKHAREHERAVDVLSILVPLFGTVANVVTKVAKP